MLDEVHQPAGPRRLANPGERVPGIGDRARRPSDQRVIDAGAGRRERFLVRPGELGRHRAGCDTEGRQPLPGLRRVHGQHRGEAGG